MSPALSVQQGRTHRVAAIAVGALALSLIASGCTVANSSNGAAARADTLRIVLPQEPPTLEACDVVADVDRRRRSLQHHRAADGAQPDYR